MGMCIGAGINSLFGCSKSNTEIAEIICRGGTSGIGVFGFETGGFIVDGGHDFEKKDREFVPSDASRIRPPPVITRCDLPSDWFFVCAIPRFQGCMRKGNSIFSGGNAL